MTSMDELTTCQYVFHFVAGRRVFVQVCLADMLVDDGSEAVKELAMKYSHDGIFFQPCDVADDKMIAGSDRYSE